MGRRHFRRLGPFRFKKGPLSVFFKPPSSVSVSYPSRSETSRAGQYVSFSLGETGNRKGIKPPLSGVLQSGLPGSQKEQFLETGHRPFHSERVPSQGTLPDGDFSIGQVSHSARRLGGVHRPVRCLLSSLDSSCVQEVSSLHRRPDCLSVQSCPLRPVISSSGIYSGDGSSGRLLSYSGNPHHPISGRLADSQLGPGGSVSRSLPCVPEGSQAGSLNQSSEIRPHSFSGFRLHRHEISDSVQSSSATRIKTSFPASSGTPLSQVARASCQTTSLLIGSPLFSIGPCSSRPSSSQATSDALASSLEASVRSSISTSSSFSVISPTSQVVDSTRDLLRGTHFQAPTIPVSFHGCQLGRMGSSFRTPGSSVFGSLGLIPTSSSHQYSRNEGCYSLFDRISVPSPGPTCHAIHGQLYGGSIYSQAGRHSLPISMCSSLATPPLLSGEQHSSVGKTSSWTSQCHCRPPLEIFSSSSSRVVSSDGGVTSYLSSLGNANGRSVRNSLECQTAIVRFPCARPLCLGGRRSVAEVGGSFSIRFSTVQLDSGGSKQNALLHKVLRYSDRTSVASEVVVSNSSRPSDRPSGSSSSSSRPSVPRSETNSSSQSFSAPSSRLEIIQRGICKKKFSPAVASLVAKARRGSTGKVYDAKWTIFHNWCRRRKVDSAKPSISEIADFLVFLFRDKQLSVSTIKGYRAMLSHTLKFSRGAARPGSDSVISELIKSFALERPFSRSLTPKWDLAVVLQALTKPPFEPLDQAELKFLSWKTVFLLAFASAKRRSELHALSIEPDLLRFNSDGSVSLAFQPGFLAKNQLPSVLPEPFSIPSLLSICGPSDPDILLCPVRALKAYIKATAVIRGKRNRLFIPTRGSQDISAATISSWLASTIRRAYAHLSSEDRQLLQVRPHEIRALSSSWAFLNKVSLDDVLKAAFWRSSSTFSSFYLRSFSSQSGAIYSLGPLVAAQTIVSA